MSVHPLEPAPVDVAPVEPAPLRLATRRSPLAMAQSRMVGEQLAALTGRTLELVEVTTRGDVDRAPLTQIGGTGVFVVAVRQALVDGRADVAVHSLKDLPTTPDERLHLAAIPSREDPRDALVAREGATLETLPVGARVGTGSPRRRAQLAVARPDLDLVDIRGNVDTRMSRVTDHGSDGLDAVVLAAAGLSRLGRQASITELIDPERVMPAPGQGALAVEVRAEGALVVGQGTPSHPGPSASAAQALTDALRSLDDPHTRAAVVAERALLAALEAGCSAPIGALAEVEDGPEPTVRLRAVLARPDGSLVRMSSTGPVDQAELVGRSLAGQMLAERGTAGTHGASSPTRQGSPTGPGPTTANGPITAVGPTTAHQGSSQ
jgi:hydroxymethylbilane synthase